MDTTTFNSTNSQSARQPRDVGAHRRAFLDTYARRRAGLSDQPEVAETVVEQPVQTVAPVQAVAPVQPVQTIEPVQPSVAKVVPVVLPDLIEDEESTAFEMQPPVVGTQSLYQPAQKADTFFAQTTQDIKEELDTPRRSYLDTLTSRNQQAVAAAPAAEETVSASTLSKLTDSLLEEPEVPVQSAEKTEDHIEAKLNALYGDYSLTNQLAKSTSSASASHVRTIVASALACGIIAVGMFTFLGRFSSQPVVAQPVDSPVIEVDSSNVKTPSSGTAKTSAGTTFAQSDPEYPTKLLIGTIGVDAPVQSLGTTSDGLIDVPQSYGVVGWYNKGAVPGKPGPAILVGHYTGGNGGVFDKLKDLNGGELITVTNGKGQTFTYKVSAKNEYERDQVPMAELFKSSSDSKLQIITCSGKWQSKNYTKRMVITAEIVK